MIRFPVFRQVDNLLNILVQNSMIGIIAVAMTLVIITGGIDLSVGAVAALSSVLLASVSGANNALLIFGLPIIVGIVLGLANGFVISRMNVAPFISSLGMMMIARGIGLVITSGNSVPFDKISKAWIMSLAKATVFGFPVLVLIWALVVALGIYVTRKTRFGRSIYAVGGNEDAAKMMGVQPENIKLIVYGISGLAAALSGVILASRLGSGQPVTCEGWEMDAIAAVAIGGTSMSGGRGSVSGTVFGVLILAIIKNMINLQGSLNSWWQSIITGALLLAVILMQVRGKRKTRERRKRYEDQLFAGIYFWRRLLRENGYRGLGPGSQKHGLRWDRYQHYVLENRTPTYLAELKRQLNALQMPIIMMTTYPDFTHPDPVQREREMLYLKADVALSSELGIRYLRILAGQAHTGVSRQDCVNWVSDAFHEIDAYGKRFGVGLLFENHGKPGAWDNVDFTFEPQNFLEICRRTQDTDIRINFDTGNITAHGEDPRDILPEVIDRVETIHVTDMAERGVFSPTVIGTGVTPNREIFQMLKTAGFDKWLCIEEASGRGLPGIQAAHDYVKETWEKA